MTHVFMIDTYRCTNIVFDFLSWTNLL